ncbi:hypothetical protein MJI95_37285, partial [Salmonella enterica subsp. enterica serovar Kentucky]|nr:hypothetical protein [Salmonella enterica subsp. enterica serovar Kentucky]
QVDESSDNNSLINPARKFTYVAPKDGDDTYVVFIIGETTRWDITIDANNCFRLRKANGLVNDIFEARHMQRLQGNMGIGHVRYP